MAVACGLGASEFAGWAWAVPVCLLRSRLCKCIADTMPSCVWRPSNKLRRRGSIQWRLFVYRFRTESYTTLLWRYRAIFCAQIRAIVTGQTIRRRRVGWCGHFVLRSHSDAAHYTIRAICIIRCGPTTARNRVLLKAGTQFGTAAIVEWQTWGPIDGRHRIVCVRCCHRKVVWGKRNVFVHIHAIFRIVDRMLFVAVTVDGGQFVIFQLESLIHIARNAGHCSTMIRCGHTHLWLSRYGTTDRLVAIVCGRRECFTVAIVCGLATYVLRKRFVVALEC